MDLYRKHVLKCVVLEKQKYMVLSIKHWAEKDLRTSIPYGIGIKTNELTSLIAYD